MRLIIILSMDKDNDIIVEFITSGENIDNLLKVEHYKSFLRNSRYYIAEIVDIEEDEMREFIKKVRIKEQ